MSKPRKRHDANELFGKLPLKVFRHPAVVGLENAAHRVLTLMAMQYNGNDNNGLQKASDAYMAEWGIKSKDTVYRSRTELLSRGLIVVTREARRLDKIPTLFALTWFDINYIDAIKLEKPQPAPFEYLNKWPQYVWSKQTQKWELADVTDDSSPRSSGRGEKNFPPIVVPPYPDRRGV